MNVWFTITRPLIFVVLVPLFSSDCFAGKNSEEPLHYIELLDLGNKSVHDR